MRFLMQQQGCSWTVEISASFHLLDIQVVSHSLTTWRLGQDQKYVADRIP